VLEIRSIHKTYGSSSERTDDSREVAAHAVAALDQVDLKIEEGEFFSLLGPSGCGKSTLLRILAGLESATSGEIFWKGRRIDQLPARSRPFNMVFQKYALFPHLSVYDNVAFGPSLKKVAAAEIRARTDEALALVNLSGFENRLPETLSGGQQQRVALARALVNRPACVLLDEPLGALDQKLRERMQGELRLLQKRLGLTFIFVTHDQEEAMILSDRIAVMNAGRLEQVSTPRELFEKPSSLFSARFVGGRNELAGKAAHRSTTAESREIFNFELAEKSLAGLSVCSELNERGDGAAIRAFVRPEMLRVVVRGSAKGIDTSSGSQNRLSGRVQQVLFRGSKCEVILEAADRLILRSMMEPQDASLLHVGDDVDLEFSPSDTHLFWAGE
jgi:spermidine/putrescine transport system ATP-binding protein